MKKLKVISGMLTIFIVLPIWFYLLYSILSSIEATQLNWFLFWVYVPVAILVAFIVKLIED